MNKPENPGKPDSANPRWIGDGKSKETAIFFTNAKGQLEHIRMQHVFVRGSGIQVAGIRYAAEREEGYVYDVWPTVQGDLRFKVPSSQTDLIEDLERALKQHQSSFAQFESRLRDALGDTPDKNKKS